MSMVRKYADLRMMDVAIAVEIFGYYVVKVEENRCSELWVELEHSDGRERNTYPSSWRRKGPLAFFSYDISSVYAMESCIPENKRMQYGKELVKIIIEEIESPNVNDPIDYLVAHASPEQRCEAALRVMTNGLWHNDRLP